MAQLRPKIVKLAKIIGGASGMLVKIDENAPEYYCMADIVTDEEADIAIAAGLRKERTAQWLADKVGRTVDEIQPSLDRLVYYGVFRRCKIDGTYEDGYFMQIFAPGILEMMVNNQELLHEHPEVGRAFEEYTRLRMQSMGPILPDGYGLMRVIPVLVPRVALEPRRRLRPSRGGHVRADGQGRGALHTHRTCKADNARGSA